jgi:hypothetical protein
MIFNHGKLSFLINGVLIYFEQPSFLSLSAHKVQVKKAQRKNLSYKSKIIFDDLSAQVLFCKI